VVRCVELLRLKELQQVLHILKNIMCSNIDTMLSFLSAVDSLGPSLEFLRLGGFDAAQRFLPPVLGATLRATMLRYTKEGKIAGETNLQLPPLIERTVACTMNEEDKALYGRYEKQIFGGFVKVLHSATIDLTNMRRKWLLDCWRLACFAFGQNICFGGDTTLSL
jgi:SNF2 family DNA or RNA helicase